MRNAMHPRAVIGRDYEWEVVSSEGCCVFPIRRERDGYRVELVDGAHRRCLGELDRFVFERRYRVTHPSPPVGTRWRPA